MSPAASWPGLNPHFSLTTWHVFQRLITGEKAADVAADLKYP
jgi:hypothetical protein